MKKYEIEEARAKFLSGLAILALGLLITWGTSQLTEGGFVVVTYGLVIVGGIRALIGLFQLLGATTRPADASTPKKWPTRDWVPYPRTVALLNLNVFGVGYLHQSRWAMWAFNLGIAALLFYALVRNLGNSVMTLVLMGLLVLWVVFSSILSYSAATKEKLARPSLPVRNDPRLHQAAIGLIAAQILFLFGLATWWSLSVRSATEMGRVAADLALSGDCAGAMSLAREVSTVQRRMLDSGSKWLRVEPICTDLLAATSAVKGGNYAKAQERFGSARQRTVGIEGSETLSRQAYNGEAEATLLSAEKYLAINGHKKNALVHYLTLLNRFPNSPASEAADLIVPDLSLEVAAVAVSAGLDPTYWYEQLVLHYPDSPQAGEARAALQDLE